ncbi:MAG TPA: TIGR01906 family membrane protein [Lachnospiraceae bacterium]|nr:TIGR01906 family membrane protein [uncultured Lachnoclostridium sp.]HAU86650.1 TIGR01906 family membrane protein [Lachnospiraceae bacterium]
MNQIVTQIRPKRNLKQKLSEWYISFVITILSISFWSVFVLFFRPLYKCSMSLFQIEKNSGFSAQRILENYNALIDYYLPWKRGNLVLPTFSQSPHAIQHFAEVKDIYNVLIGSIPIAAFLLLLYLYKHRDRYDLHYLKTASFMLVVAPFLLASGFAINFDKTFALFHKILFDNNYWLFDSKTDPIITILPDKFFMLCAVVIIVFQFLTSFVCFMLYKRGYRNQKD